MILRESIKSHEGLRLKPYRCSMGHLTIGYGWNLDDNPLPQDIQANLDVSGFITHEMAERLLDVSINTATDAAKRIFTGFDSLSEAKQEVLIEMAFQLGEGTLSRFAKLRHAVAIRDYEGAAKEMKDSLWYKQTPQRVEDLIAKWESDG